MLPAAFLQQIFRDSSMVEQSTVNRLVPGSSPGRGALKITL